MSKFWELYEKNAIISGALALIFACAVVYMSCTGQEVPVLLGSLAGAACGYYFGAGKAAATVRTLRGV